MRALLSLVVSIAILVAGVALAGVAPMGAAGHHATALAAVTDHADRAGDHDAAHGAASVVACPECAALQDCPETSLACTGLLALLSHAGSWGFPGPRGGTAAAAVSTLAGDGPRIETPPPRA